MIEHFDDARRAVAAGAAPQDAARQLVATMTPEERLWCLDGDLPGLTGLGFIAAEDGYHRAPFFAGVVERIGLPGLAFADGPRGCVLFNSTCFPVTMARGATWDPVLEERVGEAIGAELRAHGANLTGAVCVNVLRHPAWGRAQETYGEDPFHVGELGAALTRGLQRHVMACAKHYACNSMEIARFQVDIDVDEVALHEVYLPHFRRIVDEGVASVMSAYNRVNGEWCGESRGLLTDVLRDEWGFEGFVISDWVFGLRDAARSLRAGLDVEMPARLVRAHHLREALDGGEVSWDEVDVAVTRVVATLLRFDDVLAAAPPAVAVVGSPEHRALAREVAARSVVLLRNEPVDGAPALPLPSTSRIAVVGSLATQVNVGDAGSSDVWDLECRTVADGLRAAFPGALIEGTDDPAGAAQAAAGADVAIVVVGYTRVEEGEYMGDLESLPTEVFPGSDEPEIVASFDAWKTTIPPITRPERYADLALTFHAGGDRRSLRLPPGHVELIRAVAAANPRTVVVIQAGSAVVGTEWIDAVPAVVQAWYGGAEAGPALADVLVGGTEPSGRLPFSVPVDESDLPPFDPDATAFTYDRWHGWWHLERTGQPAAFPFGFGLAYTTFELDGTSVTLDGTTITVVGLVRNTGHRDGSDVVQVYARPDDPDAPPVLVGFARVEVPAGGSTAFTIEVPAGRLATRDAAAHAWRPPQGPHRLTVARWAGDPAGTATLVEL